MPQDKITFSFGRNWTSYLDTVTDREIASAEQDIKEWLGSFDISGKRVIDIGSGSGIHSYVFHRLGARSVHSLDYDQFSVGATKAMWHRAQNPANWTVEHGSILDEPYINALGKFDLVYSWGVLHHTGSMWEAVANAFRMVAPDGWLWISLYKKGPRYQRDLALKQRYNRASKLGKRYLEYRRIGKFMLSRARHLQNPFAWNRKVDRGMNVYNDVIDWLGGLPYETATEDEVITFARKSDFVLERIKATAEGGCSVYVFSKPNTSGTEADKADEEITYTTRPR
jgi:2-polyprenyl-6-hydroxyphenyl methylase/3-demethylubiquinone-9 3-methyltransferase